MSNELENHINKLYAQIGEAAKKPDLTSIQRLTHKVAELEELKQQEAAIQTRVATLIQNEIVVPSPLSVAKEKGYRELPVHITKGMIRQNLLTLTPHIKRGKVKIGEELVIEALPSGEKFQTIIMDKGNKLRARGEIGRFYKDARIQPDNYVLLSEIAPGRWTLKKTVSPPDLYHDF